MSTSKLHTLEKLLKEGIDIPTDGMEEGFKRYPIAGIIIPRIQRPYAQGRSAKNIADIRRDFVENLLITVSSKEECSLELSFIFGSLQRVNWNDAKGNNEALELLDGQQRLTTLFLLHWYLYKKECPNNLPDWLSRFRYETRDTSTAFLLKITDQFSSLNLNEIDKKTSQSIKPSEVIKKQIWYNNDFRCDTTVVSMLRMLDEIDFQYKSLEITSKTHEHSLHKNLGRIQFYIRLLLGFNMPDLLFIKMNSRGLPLIPFENFKAAVMKYMENTKAYEDKVVLNNGETAPFHFNFAADIDNKWVYLFWNRPAIPSNGSIIELNDKRTGARFFRFFNRMLFTKLAIDYSETEDSLEKEKLQAACDFFRTVAETSMDEHLTDWTTQYIPAISRWKGEKDYFRECSKVLNVLCANYGSGIKLRNEIQKAPFIETSKFEIYSKSKDANGDFTYAHRLVFSVIIDYLLHVPEDVSLTSIAIKNDIRRLIRVMHNVVEHTNRIDNENILDLIKAFHKIIISEDMQSGNFYKALANYNGNFEWLKAEADKAKDIILDEKFESVMRYAEEHPILRGRLTPIYSPGVMTVEQLSKRVAEFYRIFPVDENRICRGIAAEYGKNDSHLLIRAMISCLSDWEKINGSYITERGYIIYQGKPENSKYLSNLLFGKGKAESLFVQYFNEAFEKKDLESFLNDIIKGIDLLDIVDDGTRDVYRRLVTDSDSYKLYNWIKSRENVRKDKEPVIRWLRDAGVLNYDNTSYDRLVLTTPRRTVIPNIIAMTGAVLSDKNQEGHVDRFGEYFAYDVVIEKSLVTESGTKVSVKATFYPNGWCKVYVKSSLQQIHNLLDASIQNDESVWNHSYCDSNSAELISKKINEWAEILKKV